MINKQGYKKRLSVRILREKHLVSFPDELSAERLKEYLAKVPDVATVDEIVPASESGDGLNYIEFHFERKEGEE